MSEPPAKDVEAADAIVALLERRGYQGPEGFIVIAMALGIYIEAQPGTHRDFGPMFRGMGAVTLHMFDARRKARPPGGAGHKQDILDDLAELRVDLGEHHPR